MNMVGTPLQPGAALVLHGTQDGDRVEPFARIDHRGAVRDARQVPQHHAEAVVQRHRYAQAVAFRQAHRLADEKTVIQDVVVGERGAFRRARGAGRELDVDRVVELQLARPCRQQRDVGGVRVLADHVEIPHARRLPGADPDHVAQRGQPRRLQLAGTRGAQFRHDVGQHRKVVAGLETGRQDQRGAADFVEREFEFRRAGRPG